MSKLTIALIFAFASAASARFDYANCASGQCVGKPSGCIEDQVVYDSC
jgi:hypothetical protein